MARIRNDKTGANLIMLEALAIPNPIPLNVNLAIPLQVRVLRIG